MKIVFDAIGLRFEAEVDYFEGTPGTQWDEGEGADVDTHSLTCDGLDASFLAGSSEFHRILEAMLGACAFEYGQEVRRLCEDRAADEQYFETMEV